MTGEALAGQLGARVRTKDGWTTVAPEAVGEFVTEQHNPTNRKGVLAVEVLLPADILAGGGECLPPGGASRPRRHQRRPRVPGVRGRLAPLFAAEEQRLERAFRAGADAFPRTWCDASRDSRTSISRAWGMEEVGRETARLEALLAEVERVLGPMRHQAA